MVNMYISFVLVLYSLIKFPHSTGYGPRLTYIITNTMANQMNENHLRDVNRVPKFDGTNFREWSYELRMILQQLGLLGLAEGRVGHLLPDEVTISFSNFVHMSNHIHVRYTHMTMWQTCSIFHMWNLMHVLSPQMLHILNPACTIYTHTNMRRGKSKSFSLSISSTDKMINDPQLVTNATHRDAWILRDVMCRNYIFATLTKPMKERLYSCNTATAVWTRLDQGTASEQQKICICYGKPYTTSAMTLV